MFKPLVSIVIPTYNRSAYLKDSILSALGQTYNNIEIIVVDNNANNSVESKKVNEIIEQLNQCNRIKVQYLYSETVGNGASARNLGAFHAKGKYIALLDDDDLYEKSKIEKQILKMNEDCSDLCLCGFTRIWTKTLLTNTVIPNLSNVFIDLLSLNLDTCAGSTIILSKELFDKIGGFDESFYRHQDIEFLLRLSDNKISVVEESLSVIRIHSESNLPKNIDTIIEIREKVINKFATIIQQMSLINRNNIYYSNNYYYLIQSIKYKKLAYAIKYLIKSNDKVRLLKDLSKKIYMFIRDKFVATQ